MVLVLSLLFATSKSKSMCCRLTISLIMRQSVRNLTTERQPSFNRQSSNLGPCLSTSSEVNSYIILPPAESSRPHYGHSERGEGRRKRFIGSEAIFAE